jgi:hypothetical protein
MKFFQKTILLVFLITMVGYTKAQNVGSDYTTAVGAKFYPTGITVKHFIQEDRAVEGILYLYADGYRLTGLYEFHGDISSVEGLKWYAGFGAHIGSFSEQWKMDNPNKNHGTIVGPDAILGLDFKFTGAPVNLSIDWQPSYNFTGYQYFEPAFGGLSIRYTF